MATQMPIHVVAFTLGAIYFLIRCLANNLGFDWPVSWE